MANFSQLSHWKQGSLTAEKSNTDLITENDISASFALNYLITFTADQTKQSSTIQYCL